MEVLCSLLGIGIFERRAITGAVLHDNGDGADAQASIELGAFAPILDFLTARCVRTSCGFHHFCDGSCTLGADLGNTCGIGDCCYAFVILIQDLARILRVFRMLGVFGFEDLERIGSFRCDLIVRAVHAAPCDGDGHIVIGHHEAIVAFAEPHVDIIAILALIARVVIDQQPAICNIAFADAVIGDALDLIRDITDLDGQAALHIICERLCGIFREEEVFITDRPVLACNRERRLVVLKDRITGMEICRVIQIGKQADLRQRCQLFRLQVPLSCSRVPLSQT